MDTKPSARLKKHVEFLCQTNPTRRADENASTALAAEYIAHQMRAAGLAVTYQEYLADGRVQRNVVGSYGTGKNPVMVVGAHYDTGEESPGADDNASGVAGLLEVARRLSSERVRQDFEFVAFATEEPPYFGTEQMGSVAHAKALKKSGRQVLGMVALESIGYFSDRPDSQRYPVDGHGNHLPHHRQLHRRAVTRPQDQEWLASFASRHENSLPPGCAASSGPHHGHRNATFSDHQSYWAQGFPALMVTGTAFLRNPHYHSESDTPETLDYIRLAQVVDGVVAALTPTK